MSNGKEYIEFSCIEVTQPIGKFYVGIIDYNDLSYISYADVRRLEDEREVETYIGIQRPLSPKRVKEIGRYVTLVDATFPTSVILTISSENVTFNKNTSVMRITYKQDVAKVLDGQHRIAGLENCKLPGEAFQINVTIFVDMELEDQAIVFATINQTQTKVNKSLVADLFEFARSRSPQKTAHNIARALNDKNGSPFYKKIKVLGTAMDKEKETITQATFVESLLKYITKDRASDRDLYKRGKKPSRVSGAEILTLPFRNLFIDEQDTKIATILWNYFTAVRERWPGAWDNIQPEMILNRSTGFIALMRFLGDAYNSSDKSDQVVSIENFKNIFDKVELQDDDFNRQKYIPGSGGQSSLYKDLLSFWRRQ
jgi:DGQHR domain-containing protein